MFTLRPSDPRTVLLWGDRWHFPDRDASEPFTHVTEAAEMLAAHFADDPKPVRLRLIFQPDSLESVLMPCPQGDRRVMAFALAGECPVLAQPEHAWGHEPVLPTPEGFATILHYEREPALITLAAQLARLGLAVDSAWPLTTFLHSLPEEWSDSGAVTVVAVRAESGVAYHHPKDAARSVAGWRSQAALAEAGKWLAGILAENLGDPVLLVCDNEETVAALDVYTADHERTNLDVVNVREVLGRRVVMPRYHPAQLLPRPPAVTSQKLAVAASIALLLVSGWAGVAFARDWTAVRDEHESRAARFAALQAEVSHLRTNASEITVLRNAVDGSAGGPPYATLLRALSTKVPPEIVLASVRLTGREFEVNGWLAPSAPAELLDTWRHSIVQSDATWSLEVHSASNGAFVAKGAFVQ